MDYWWLVIPLGMMSAAVYWAMRRARVVVPPADPDRAAREFRLRREALEAKFLQLAAASGKPRGLVWQECEFVDAVSYARNKHTGELTSFVAVTIRFHAEVDGPMEDVPNASLPKAATAVFHYDGKHWATDGRAVFNLSPEEAIQHFRHDYEMVKVGGGAI